MEPQGGVARGVVRVPDDRAPRVGSHALQFTGNLKFVTTHCCILHVNIISLHLSNKLLSTAHVYSINKHDFVHVQVYAKLLINFDHSR